MRNNQPVTQREYVLDEETVLISRSDLKGNVTCANAAFVEVSGYSREELMGAPHNMIRHPDMPEAAYADFWKTIQAGGTWQGTVKNRRKNGDHYWVNATVAPLRDGERIVGYTSLRRKASAKRIAQAEQVYAEIRAKGKSRRYRLHQGALTRRGLGGLLARFQFSSLKAKLTGMVITALLLLGMAGGLGVYGLMVSGERLDTLNRSGLEAIANLQLMERQVGLTVEQLEPAVRNPRRVDLVAFESRLQEVTQSVQTLWDEYESDSAAEPDVLQRVEESLNAWITGVTSAMAAVSQANGFAAFEAFNDAVQPATEQLRQLSDQLVDAEREGAHALVAQAHQGRQQMLVAQLVLMAVGLLVMIGLSVIILRSVMRSLAGARYMTFQIAAGNLAARERRQSNDELGELLYSLDTMRFSLSSIVSEVENRVSVVTPAIQQIAAENGVSGLFGCYARLNGGQQAKLTTG